jgi:hypothetical protein
MGQPTNDGNIVKRTSQYLDNLEHDEISGGKGVAIYGTPDGSNVYRLKVNSDGSITASTTAGRWANYADARQDLSGDPMYFGKEDTDGNWVIKRFGITSNTTMYFEGTGGISSNWAGRAGYTYVEFNAL